MTTESFFKAYMSTDIEQRRLAEMYVVGVIDSSEGELWCGYGIASPDAIQEQVYTGLKRALENSPRQRASTAIKSQLKELLPCKEAK
ncbi:Rap1a/Tai family immunity protein [Nitrincola sp. MINF-07-Sa-05]|uniref:Rap1a/Tai family immunity protein n=1 Tax=Nitrincola salilacus TaxID=3400273 RepID=UPI003917CCA2